MDADSHEPSRWYSFSLQNSEGNSGTVDRAELHEMHCLVCGRTFVPFIGENEGLDSLTIICRDCKFLVMNDNDSSFITRNSLRSRRRRTSTYGSSESVENLLPQQFSQPMVRQNHDQQLDEDAMFSSHQRSTRSSFRNWPRRAHMSHSETDNESIDVMDSLFGETDSHLSYGGYRGDSDASVDRHGIIYRETPSPLDYDSRIHSDADIDPMHAGMDQWTSDDPSEYGEWDDSSTRDASVQLMGPNESSASPHVLWSVHETDLFTDVDEIDLSPFTGNSGDYMDAQGFEDLLEQLAVADGSRIGAPPTAASSLQNLPCIIVSKDHEKDGALVCAVCKDPLPIGSEAKQLPCSHLYHPSCILPWLRTRNSCPVCRYELPTDDQEYEKGKQNNARNEIRRQEVFDERYSDGSSDLGDEANEDDNIGASDRAAGGSSYGGNGRWLLVAAAPIVAIVSIAVAVLVRNSMAGSRLQIHHGVRDCDAQSRRSRGAVACENRSWSWWPRSQ